MDYSMRVQQLLKRHRTMTLQHLRKELKGRSRRSIFRDMQFLEYMASYSHKGKYFTLKEVADFNSDGLWFCGNVRFSHHGNLRETVKVLIESSESGYTHMELQQRLAIRAHNTLYFLTNAQQIRRARERGLYVYVSKSERGDKQLKQRRSMNSERTVLKGIGLSKIVEVLAEVIRQNGIVANASEIASGLSVCGVDIAVKQAEQIIEYYQVKKN